MSIETMLRRRRCIGASSGFLGGLFGKGGSAIATPLLALVGHPADRGGRVAAAGDHPVDARRVVRLLARSGSIDWEIFRWCLLVGIPATAVGAYATRWIGGDAARDGHRGRRHRRSGSASSSGPGDPHEIAVEPPAYRARMVAVAAAVGLLSGLLANAGGFLLAPLFVVVLRLSLKQSFATSLAVAAVLAVPGTIVHALARPHRLGGGRRLRRDLDPALVPRGPHRAADATRSTSSGPTAPASPSWARRSW